MLPAATGMIVPCFNAVTRIFDTIAKVLKMPHCHVFSPGNSERQASTALDQVSGERTLKDENVMASDVFRSTLSANAHFFITWMLISGHEIC